MPRNNLAADSRQRRQTSRLDATFCLLARTRRPGTSRGQLGIDNVIGPYAAKRDMLSGLFLRCLSKNPSNIASLCFLVEAAGWLRGEAEAAPVRHHHDVVARKVRRQRAPTCSPFRHSHAGARLQTPVYQSVRKWSRPRAGRALQQTWVENQIGRVRVLPFSIWSAQNFHHWLNGGGRPGTPSRVRVVQRFWYAWKMWSFAFTATWHACPQSEGLGSAVNLSDAAS
jgi:hypothetical protein